MYLLNLIFEIALNIRQFILPNVRACVLCARISVLRAGAADRSGVFFFFARATVNGRVRINMVPT